MKHNGHPSDVLTDTKSLTDMLINPRLPTYWCIPYSICRYPLEHTDIQGSIQMCGGVGHKGSCPNVWGCPNIWQAPCTPYHMQILPRANGWTGEQWGHTGVFELMGALGHLNKWGCTDVPLSMKTCLSQGKVGKNLFKARFLHLKSWKNN